MSNACPSGVGVKGEAEAEGEEGRAEVCRAEFTSDAENQGSLTPDAVALDSGRVVCKRTPLNRTEDSVDEKLGMLGLVGLREAASFAKEGWEVELSAWISGRPLGLAEIPPSVVVSSSTGRARPRSVLAWMKDDVVVLLMSLVRDLNVVMVVLYGETPLPPFVFVLVNVGVVVLTASVVSEESFGLMPPRTPSVSAAEYKGVVEVELETSLVVVVEKKGALPLKSALPLVSDVRVTSGGCVEVLWRAVSSEWLRTGSYWVDLTQGTGSVVVFL